MSDAPVNKIGMTVTAADAARIRGGRKSATLTHAASKGVLWSGVNTVVGSAVRFVTTAILARQLMPADFGVLAMAFLVNEALILFGELGLSAAAIQKKEIDDTYYNTLFWATLAIGVALAGCFLLAAPVAAAFFNNDQVRPVVMVLSVNFLLSSAGSVYRTILTRQLRFDRFALVNITATLVRSAVAIICVFSGFGLWAVVFGMLAERVMMLVMVYSVVKWVPQFEFHPRKFWELFRFSRNLYGENFLRFFNMKSDVLISGKVLGAAGVGIYNFAWAIPSLIVTQFSQTITNVLFPVYCKVQDDHGRFQRGYTKTLMYISLISAPVMIGLIVVAPEFVRFVYGERWMPVVAPLRVLCALAMVNSVLHTMGSVFKAKGRPDLGFKWNCVTLPLTIGALLIGARWGVIGIAWAMMIVGLLSFLPLWKAISLIGLPVRQAAAALTPAFAASLLMAAVLAGIKTGLEIFRVSLPDVALLVMLVPSGMAIYTLAVWRYWPETFTEFWRFLGKMVK